MAMGYLPLAVVRNSFQILTTSPDTRRLRGVYPEVRDFLHYLQDTYLSVNATFPPAVWNVFGRGPENRTNNRVEGTVITSGGQNLSNYLYFSTDSQDLYSSIRCL